MLESRRFGMYILVAEPCCSFHKRIVIFDRHREGQLDSENRVPRIMPVPKVWEVGDFST